MSPKITLIIRKEQNLEKCKIRILRTDYAIEEKKFSLLNVYFCGSVPLKWNPRVDSEKGSLILQLKQTLGIFFQRVNKNIF